MKKESDKYLKIVEWSDEDGCYVGTCPGLMLGGVHGKNEAKVYAELCKVAEEWVRLYKKDGVPLPEATADREYSGKFMLRPGKNLHKILSINALKLDESLNSYCTRLLQSKVRISLR